MFCVVWYYSCSIRKAKKFKQNTLLESYKNEIKILAKPGLASSGYEQPGPGDQMTIVVHCLKYTILKLRLLDRK